MGFICEHYNDNRAGLIVSFRGDETTDTFFAGDSAQAAMEYFNLYVENDIIFSKSDESIAMETAGIESVDEAAALREKINEIINAYSDEQAVDNIILFPAWLAGKRYIVGARVRYNEKLYKVLQEHTSQADWTPDVAVSLFAEIPTGEGDEPQEWVQPDSTNPYMTGDRVKFEGHIYESLIDNNIWSPTAYPAGWQLIE